MVFARMIGFLGADAHTHTHTHTLEKERNLKRRRRRRGTGGALLIALSERTCFKWGDEEKNLSFNRKSVR